MVYVNIFLLETSIDALPSKNQVLREFCTHVNHYKFISLFPFLREKRLITKEHIVTHTHLNFNF